MLSKTKQSCHKDVTYLQTDSCPSHWELHLQTGSKSKWRILKGKKISIYSTLGLLSHSSSMPPTNFHSFTKYFWCCPYYDFFFLFHTSYFFEKYYLNVVLGLVLNKLLHCGSSAETQMRANDCLYLILFCSSGVCSLRILGMFSQLPRDLISILKM